MVMLHVETPKQPPPVSKTAAATLSTIAVPPKMDFSLHPTCECFRSDTV